MTDAHPQRNWLRIAATALSALCIAGGMLAAALPAFGLFLATCAPVPPGTSTSGLAHDSGILFLACIAFAVLPAVTIAPAVIRMVLAVGLLGWVVLTTFQTLSPNESQWLKLLFSAAIGVLLIALLLQALSPPRGG
jgi:hypothetical protein